MQCQLRFVEMFPRWFSPPPALSVGFGRTCLVFNLGKEIGVPGSQLVLGPALSVLCFWAETAALVTEGLMLMELRGDLSHPGLGQRAAQCLPCRSTPVFLEPEGMFQGSLF